MTETLTALTEVPQMCSGGLQRSSLHERGVDATEQPFGCVPVQGFAGPSVELVGDPAEVVGVVDAQVGALREVVAEEPVGVLIAGPLSGASGVAQVDGHGRRCG